MNQDVNKNNALDINPSSNCEDIELISADVLDAGTLRMVFRIKGHLFKRLSNRYYPVVWNDEEGTFNDCLAMKPEQEKELEGIFKAWAITNGIQERSCLKK